MQVHMTPRLVRRVALPMAVITLAVAACNKPAEFQDTSYVEQEYYVPDELLGLVGQGNIGQAGMNIDSTTFANLKGCMQDLDSLAEKHVDDIFGGLGGVNP